MLMYICLCVSDIVKYFTNSITIKLFEYEIYLFLTNYTNKFAVKTFEDAQNPGYIPAYYTIDLMQRLKLSLSIFFFLFFPDT